MAWEPPWDLGSVILELYLLSLLEESVRGGEGSAVTGWAAQEKVDRRRRRESRVLEERTLCGGKRVARGEMMVACIAARA